VSRANQETTMPDELAAEKGAGSDAVSTLSNYLAIRQGLHWNSHHASWLVQELSHLLNRGGHSVSVKGQLVRLNSAGITRAVQLFGRELQRMFSVRLATQMKRIRHACT
jgi:hypothetical protein